MESEVEMDEELWKDIKGYEGRYQASDQGKNKSINRTITNCRGRKQSFRETILRPDYAPNGYERVSLPRDGKYKHHRVAKIIYETFAGPVPEGMEIDHINGDNRDNRLENLRVCTHKENCNNPITLERGRRANQMRSQKMKEWWAKKKAASTM